MPIPKSGPRAALGLLVALVVVFATAAPSQAHSELVSSSPEEGAALTVMPQQVKLTFSDGVNPKFATLLLSGPGTEPIILDRKVSGATVIAQIPATAPTPSGRWHVAYRIVSVDGHPVEGEVLFSIKTGAVAPGPQPSPSVATPSPAADPKPAQKDDDVSTTQLYLEVLMLAVLVAIPVGFFVVASAKQRRKDAERRAGR